METGKKPRKKAYLPQARLLLVKGGREYFDRLQDLIRTATQSIHIQMYIFSYDATGRMVMKWLRQAAARGISIYLLVDGYATKLPAELLRSVIDTNLHIEQFDPIFKKRNFYFGRRLHHKIVVADGRRALAGSNNIDDHYYGRTGHPAWMDMALYVEGSAAGELERVCIQLWNKTADRSRQLKVPGFESVLAEKTPTGISVGIRCNDWVSNRQEISKSYFNLLNKARENVYLVSSYFLPGRRLRRQMKLAVRRGVKVRVITAGISDVGIAKQAERYLYPWLLRNGIEVYEYFDTILHAKMGIRDSRWLTLGSFNINNISTYASIELNLDVRNRSFVRQMQQELEQLIVTSCTRVTEEQFRNGQTPFTGLVQRFSYNIIRIILYLSTFYFKREQVSNKYF